MTSQELKNYILEHNKIEYILNELGCRSITFHPEKNYWTATQPNGDNLMGVVICQFTYLNYFSYSRNIHIEEQRDIFYLIQQVKKLSFSETMKYVHKLLGVKYSFKKEQKEIKEFKDPLIVFTKHEQKRKKPVVNVLDFDILDESILDDFVPMIHINLFREGIINKTIQKFGLGYSYKYKRTIFPHRLWSTGELIGYNARTSVDSHDELGIKKYFLTPGMKKENNVYGLYENFNDIKNAGYITVFESEKSVLKRDSLGDSTGVALSGHSMSDIQSNIIAALDLKEVVIAMDKDVSEEEIWHICAKFYHRRRVSYIYDKYDLLGKKDSPADALNKVYNFLFKHRIHYGEIEHQKYLKSLEKK